MGEPEQRRNLRDDDDGREAQAKTGDDRPWHVPDRVAQAQHAEHDLHGARQHHASEGQRQHVGHAGRVDTGHARQSKQRHEDAAEQQTHGRHRAAVQHRIVPGEGDDEAARRRGDHRTGDAQAGEGGTQWRERQGTQRNGNGERHQRAR